MAEVKGPRPQTCAVVVHYNTPRETRQCLEGLSASLCPAEVVVVDNASTRGDIRDVCAGFDNVKVLNPAENLGFGRGNNLGMAWALDNTECRYIFLLNSDAYVAPDTVGLLEGFMDSAPGASIAAPRITYAREPGTIWYGGGEIVWGRGGARVHGFRKPFDGRVEPVETGFVSGCALFIRREALERLGGFDPLFFMYAEDVEYSARAAAAGARMYYVPSALVRHDVHASIRQAGGYFDHYESPGNRSLPFFLEHGLCNMMVTVLRHASATEAAIGLSYLFAKWGMLGIKCILRGQGGALLGLWRGLRRFFSLPHRDFQDELGNLRGGA